MSADPRKTFSVKYCPRGGVQQQGEQAKRKGFLESITKIGDLEILNDIGFGKVGEGLRVLSSVSDSIRVGESIVPGREGNSTYNSALGKITGMAKDAINDGAQVVMDTTGLGGVTEAVGDFHPEVANRAWGQAKNIYSKVKDGDYSLKDIPGTFQDLQNLETLGRGIFGTSDTKKNATREFAMCSASPYAVDLISHAPKFNFLFVIDVQFSEPYQAWKDIGSTMAFVVKRSSRPGFEVEYEDINMYNFRTKVAKSVQYPPMSMSFYDDNKNAAHLFYTAYMRAMSPIANMDNRMPQTEQYEVNSMNFDKGPDSSSFDSSGPLTRGYAASLGPLEGNVKNIVSRIRLYHIFDYGRLMNIYNFYNPRILSFTPTELNMAETGDGAEFEFQFDFDGMFVEPGWSIQAGGDNKEVEKLTDNGGTALYPIKPVFDDLTFTDENSQQGLAPIAQEQLANGGPDSTENMRSTLGSGLGKSPIATDASGQIGNFTNGITGAINDAKQQVSGLANKATSAARNAAGEISSTVSNAFTSAKSFTGSLFSSKSDDSFYI